MAHVKARAPRGAGRALILARDQRVCGLCNVVAGREARAMPLNFLRVVKVDPDRPATAENLVTACKRCAGRWEGLKLAPGAEGTILAMNRVLNAESGIPNDQLVEDWA